ncbi:MAG: hypothetical protein JJU20_09785 [Opitutales bacterium]|nr:hypothetical protein [Opitutales bacterium]
MKVILPLCLSSLIGFGVAVQAQELIVSVQSMLNPTTFHLNQQHDLDVRVLETERLGDSTSHLLINGLDRYSDDAPANVVTSNYEGINASTGATQERGIIQLTLPDGAIDSNGTSSPIVGVVARSGSWSDYNAQPSDTVLGGQTGLSQFNTGSNLEGTLDISISGGFTGTANYTAESATVLNLEAFTLSNGSTSRSFFPTTVTWDGATRSYVGPLMTSNDYTADLYDSTFFTLRLSNIPDADRDGIPDIADPNVQVDLVVAMGEWTADSRIGNFRGTTSEWAYSTKLGFFAPGRFPWIYQAHYGWLRFETRLPSPDNHVVWYYSAEASSWVYVNERSAVGGQFFWWNGSSNEWVEGNFLTGPETIPLADF